MTGTPRGTKLTDDTGKIMRTAGERVSTTDGPYPESKEVVGGFFVISARDYAEACRLAETCPRDHPNRGRIWP